MKTTLTVLVVLFLGLLIYFRQRIYVRDPIATVYRDSVQQNGVQVFINYSNDVLLEREEQPGAYRILLQDWNKMPGTPLSLTCIHWMACFTDADDADSIPLVSTRKGKYDPKVFMTGHEVQFVDGNGASMRIELR